MKKLAYGCLVLVLFGASACKKFVEVPPPSTEISGVSVFSSNATAGGAVSGIYLDMGSNCIGGGIQGISVLLGCSADEFTLYTNSTSLMVTQAYTDALQSTNAPVIWTNLYNIIYEANAAIAGISASTGVSPSMQQQLVGESEFIRAFCYFYLVNIYGNAPLVLSSDYHSTEGLPRTSVSSVYKQIISDLKDAQTKLPVGYVDGTGAASSERVRPNVAAASALLSRAYLYTDSVQNAEQEATAVINNLAFQLDPNLNNVFISTSVEAIWQLEIPATGFNTADGAIFLLSDFGGPSGFYPFLLSNSIVKGFEAGDLRRMNWVDSIVVSGAAYYFPYKYKLYLTGGAPPTEFPTMLRLGEQYLIRAEARARQGELTGAISDLNAIRSRAGLTPTTAATQSDLVAAIMRERRFELFTEYGHRWLDLKRSGQVDSVMAVAAPLKGGTWTSNDELYPIPYTDVQSDPNLVQNPGYQ